jgi:dTDP-4-amino-4,6-dideoxygalactose transaminase
MQKTYQLFKPAFHKEEIFKLMSDCFDRGWTGLGNLTDKFEEDWKEYTGHKYAHFLNSATVGLHLAFNIYKKKYKWEDGDEIISTPLTFISSNASILYEHLKIVFADIDEYGTLDPKDVLSKITPKTKAILFVGLGGNIGSYTEIVKIAKEKNIKIILDAAHMAGSRYKGEIVGKDADCIIYSFQAVKNLPTADSGMICFSEEEDDKLVRQLSWLGIDKNTFQRSTSQGAYKWKYDIPNLGYKYHGNSIIAAIGIVELKYLDMSNAYRRTLAQWYTDNLEPNGIKIIKHKNKEETSQHLFQILVQDRDKVLMGLNNVNIFPGVHYCSNDAYAPFSVEYDLPKAHKFSDTTLSLPLHLGLTKNDIDYISNQVISVLNI